MEALGINWGFLLVQILNVVLLFVITRALLWKPIVEMLEKRKGTIEKGLEDARVAAEARANAEKEAETIKAAARSEAQQIVADARTRAEEAAKSVYNEAEKEAGIIRTEARTKAEEERTSALSDMRSQVVSLAIAAANKLIGESMSKDKQSQIVNDFFTKAPDGIKGLGDNITVISALPLTDVEQNRIKSETGAAHAEFKVQPEILGGVIIRAGDKVVDGSVRSSLSAMSARLN